MNRSIARLIRDTAAQLDAVLRQSVIDAMLGNAPTARVQSAPPAVTGPRVGRPRDAAAVEAARIAVAEGLSSVAASKRFGVPQTSVCRHMRRLRRDGDAPIRQVGSATQRAVARVAAGETQSAAARAEGIDVSGVCRAVAKARRRGEFAAPIRKQGRPVNESAVRAARFAINNRLTARRASIEFGVKMSAVAWHMAKMRKVTP